MKFDVVIVDNKEMLYVESREVREKLKIKNGGFDGDAYLYDIRHNDRGEFCTIEDGMVICNWSGTLVSNKPLRFYETSWLEIADDENLAPNFTGERMTIKEYLQR